MDWWIDGQVEQVLAQQYNSTVIVDEEEDILVIRIFRGWDAYTFKFILSDDGQRNHFSPDFQPDTDQFFSDNILV